MVVHHDTISCNIPMGSVLGPLNEDMGEFHARLERVEQARLEFINLRRLSGNLEPQSNEGGAPASEQWSGATPTYPPF